MATRGKRPEGGKSDVSWTFDKVKAGERRSGWLAGPTHGVYCHCDGVSKPCLRVLCGKSAKCPGCSDGVKVAWAGYVPLRRHDGRPLVVLIRESAAAIVDRLEGGARVTWGRNEGRGEGVWITAALSGPEWRHFYPTTAPTVDLTNWLMRLWRLPEIGAPLVKWFANVDATPIIVEQPAKPEETMIGQGNEWVDGVANAALRTELNIGDAEAKRIMKQRSQAFVDEVRKNGKK